jgi:DnaJ-class molecular chaperone
MLDATVYTKVFGDKLYSCKCEAILCNTCKGMGVTKLTLYDVSELPTWPLSHHCSSCEGRGWKVKQTVSQSKIA